MLAGLFRVGLGLVNPALGLERFVVGHVADALFCLALGFLALVANLVIESHDVTDPFGGNLAAYRRCAEELAQGAKRW